MPSSDPYGQQVVLLLDGSGSNGSTTIIDKSLSAKAVTTIGATITTAQSPFAGGGSIDFDGASSLRLDSSSDWSFGTGDWTIEMWLRFSALLTTTLCGTYKDSASGWAFQWRSDIGGLAFGVGDIRWLDATWTPTVGAWHYVAIRRASGVIQISANGAQYGSTTNAASIISADSLLSVGNLNFAGGIQFFNGQIGAIRITKSIARSILSVPTEPFPVPIPTVVVRSVGYPH